MGTKYIRSPIARVSRYGDRGLFIVAGTGNKRSAQEIEGELAGRYLHWLFEERPAMDRDELASDLQQTLSFSRDNAEELVDEGLASEVFVAAEGGEKQTERLRRWSRMGWRDAADFHLGTSELPFRPDTADGELYDRAYETMLRNTSIVGEQPAPDYSRGLDYSTVAVAPRSDLSLDEVLSGHEPINYFGDPDAGADNVLAALADAVGVQKEVDVRLGTHYYKAFPSGGARHPLEVYLVIKNLDGLAPGVYHFHALAKGFELLRAGDVGAEIDRACFGKGGILSAGAVAVVTARWKRHNWKYRYAKSYRMVLLEVGHLIQALSLSLAAYGVRGYFCPSINDAALRELLRIDDDVEESPMYAIGLGKEARR